MPATITLVQQIELCAQQLAKQPNNCQLLNQLAFLYVNNNEYDKALACLQKILALEPTNPAVHNNLGNVLCRKKQLNKAEQHYKEALKLKANYPEALNNLGSCLYKRSLLKQASEYFAKAIRIAPDYTEAYFNLANCYAQDNRPYDAKQYYLRVLELNPEHLYAQYNLGILLANLTDFTEAEAVLRKTLLKIDDVEIKFHLAMVLSTKDDDISATEACKLYEEILKVAPEHIKSLHNLATLYLRSNHVAKEESLNKALALYRKAYALDTENLTAKHMIAALGGESTSSAPNKYIRQLFDQYAETYNEHMINTLNYQVPFLLRQLISPHIQKLNKPSTVLDIGCGTGLCGIYFKDLADKLYGVDISSAMITKAKKSGFYDKLTTADLLEQLDILIKSKQNLDLILAADVLVYHGDLNNIFKQCYQALTNNGYFLFSVENPSIDKKNNQQKEHGFKLQPTGRFCHSKEYITKLCQAHNFVLLEQKTATLRTNAQEDILGSLYLLKKQAATVL